MLGFFCKLKMQSAQKYNHPIGENSPNPVTLVANVSF
jgi:hypothetical protein